MKFTKHVEEVIHEGNQDCDHVFVGKKGKIGVFPLSYSQEKTAIIASGILERPQNSFMKTRLLLKLRSSGSRLEKVKS